MKNNHLIKLQPNKMPFLFLEDLVEVTPEKKVVNEYYLDSELWFFKCHWENDPNMPAMLQLEAMSQTASICLFSLKTPPQKLYLVSIENATFRKKIKPKMKIEITSIFLERTQNIYKFKSVIREKDNRTLLSKSFLKLLWPEN